MEQILFTYGLPKDTVAVVMMLYRNTKVRVCSPDGDTDYFNIVAGLLQVDTLAPYLFLICLEYILKTTIDRMKEKFQPNKGKKQKVTDTNNYRHGLSQ